MKMGMVIKQGTEKEVTRDFNKLKNDAKTNFTDCYAEINKGFSIVKTDIKIDFILDKCFRDEYAIYQIIK